MDINNTYDIIIIGAGPAGLTSAIYACRASKKTLILEAKNYGGQIITAKDIENYPATPHISGFDLATQMYTQALELGADVKFETVLDISSDKRVLTNKATYQTKAIIVATGSDYRKLGLDNEERLTGKGVSYCATCDGNFFRGKEVAVTGGGNSALEDALYLSDLCSKVYLIHRRDEFRGDAATLNKIKSKENIEIILNTNVTKINGDDFLSSIEITDNDKNTKELKISGLFVAVGRIPYNENFGKTIELDENGYAVSGEDCKTNVPGIFVAGDFRTKTLRQLVTATGDGAVAAVNAIAYINSIK